MTFKGETLYSVDVDVDRERNGVWATATFFAEEVRSGLAHATARAIREAIYYVVCCGYAARFSITQHCATCGGEGKVPKKRSFGDKKCPHCNGDKKLVLSQVPVSLSQNAIDDLKNGSSPLVESTVSCKCGSVNAICLQCDEQLC